VATPGLSRRGFGGPIGLRGVPPLIEDQLFEVVESVLDPLGFRMEDGEEYREPALDVLRYYRRPVKLHWLPFLGRSQAVVAVVRQPVDVGLSGSKADYRALMGRLALAASGRFPPSRALGFGSIGLTAVVLTPEPIAAGDDELLKGALGGGPGRSRAVPLGVIRLNLGQEAMSHQLSGGPDGLFPEPVALADALTVRFRRFVPLIEWD